MKRAIGRNGFKKIYSYTWENQGENKKVFRAKIKGLPSKGKPKKFFILDTPADLWQSEQPNGQKIKELDMFIKD